MVIQNRYDFTMIFDVENGNPNGDPDAGNNPRIDAETGIGIVTDVCLKRKIRNYIDLKKNGEQGYNILIKADKSLNSKFEDAYKASSIEIKKGKNKDIDDVRKARDYMCANYYDVRTFGAVMSTGDNPCGIVRGPVQINFAKSISPINIQDITITRQCRTVEEKHDTGNTTEMGRKSIVPYALYRSDGYVSAALAQNITKFNEEDMNLLWEAVANMFEHDHSAARGKMCMRKLYVFKHDNILGNCPSHILFDKISIKPLTDIPRGFLNYNITVDENMPKGVTFISKI